eukprot:TRINITY_DN92_c0_g1_i3.p1 TRINITY_DN92_c0_g1~~TRINITY_DN92_c0_g1_i3.p1  ORF type:complete len:276 (-),score=36.64 TRINITY_DN92_c0_g1_i3:159-986(-)
MPWLPYVSSFRLPPGRKWFHRTYWFDYALCISLFLLLGALQIMIGPTHRGYEEGDPSLDHPYREHEIVPVSLLFVFSFLLPAVFFILSYFFLFQSVHDLHNAVLGLFTSVCLAEVITDFTKLGAGRLRPDFLDRLDHGSSTRLEGRKSFPSGHATMAFASMMFVSLYLMGKMRVMSSTRRRSPLFAEAIVPLFPLILAFFVAISRVVDYRHHFSDILAGAVIGSAVAVYLYLMSFESLMSNRSEHPRLRCSSGEECDGSIEVTRYSPASQDIDEA